uniref:Uncharacterized protein n=1 Tax=Globisporangium ultimum (strain ATCC 200006 / CBS 805.95 / DAOM BR144) TaxID=431595 RepID=K3X221_GLOUD
MTSSPSSATAAPATGGSGGLVCGRCRRKTSELVSKLCHACGAPLHPSCSDEVAVRECALDYGFPAPMGFCSKRCYETDLLAHGAQPSSVQIPQQPKRLPLVPNEITAALTVKIGDVSRTSRKQLSLTTFRFLLSEGFEVFKAKANSRTTKELQTAAASTDNYVREDRAVYIKPGVHSKQAELVELTERNFEARVARSYRNFLKRKPGGSEHFECDVLTYVRKDTHRNKRSGNNSASSTTGRQVNAVKSTSQLQTFMEYTDAHPRGAGSMVDAINGLSLPIVSLQNAPSSGASLAAAAAMAGDLHGAASGNKRRHTQLLSDSPSQQPQMLMGGTGNSGMMMMMNTSNAPLQDPQDDQAYKTVRMVLNGSVVAVKVNVRDLLACFNMAPATPSSFAPMAPPTVSSDDLHGSSSNSNVATATTTTTSVHDI